MLNPAVPLTETVTPLGDGRTRLEFAVVGDLAALTTYDLQIPTTIDAGVTFGVDLVNSIEMTADNVLIGNGIEWTRSATSAPCIR